VIPESPPFPFIVGSGRCGSTLLRVMFDSHPDMAVPVEVYFPTTAPSAWFDSEGSIMVERAAENLAGRPWYPKLRLPSGAFLAQVRDRAPTNYADLIRCLYRTYADAQGKPRYGNKSPMYVARLPRLAEMFPEARFIHIVRDGRNVALSYLENNFGPTDLASAARAWRIRVSRGRRAGYQLGEDRYAEVRYEDLLEDPERELRRLCAFVELGYDDAMLRYYERIPTMVMGSGPHTKLSLPPTKGMRDWRGQMRGWQAALFESIAGPTLQEFGYELSGVIPTLGDRIRIGSAKARSELPRRIRRGARHSVHALRRWSPVAQESGHD
jgi:Sulfotransferase family